MTDDVKASSDYAPARWAAGEDPAKRQQILDGAKRVFRKLGFDGASMNDVTREAGVSKGTLYVYFDNKEDLFAALINSEKQEFVATARLALQRHEDIATNLYDFGMVFVAHLTTDKVIGTMRMLLGVRERMPNLCQRFFTGPENIRTVLMDYLNACAAEDRLQIDDIELAARQFLEMSSGSFFKLRLFGDMDAPPSEQEMHRVVAGAVHVFMAAYGMDQRPSNFSLTKF